MTMYRNIWTVVVTTLGALGVCIALHELTVIGVLEASLACGLLGTATAWSLLADDGNLPIRRPLKIGLLSALVAPGVFGLIVLTGGVSALLLIVVALTSPWFLAWVLHPRTHLRTRRVAATGDGAGCGPVAEAADPTEPFAEEAGLIDRDIDAEVWVPADALDDAGLCRAWRHSFLALQRTHSVASRQRIVDFRQSLLDELERRDPHALQTWLKSGARAAGDPSRFLATPGRHQHRRPGS